MTKSNNLLTREEEIELAKLKDGGDLKARNTLIERNLLLVHSIAKKYKIDGVPYQDIYNEGVLGLMIGVDKYDWTRGNRLSTCVWWWITQSILAFISQNQTIRLPSHIQNAKRQIAKTKKQFKKENGREPTEEELAEILDLDCDKIEKIDNFNNNIIYFSEKEDEEEGNNLADTLLQSGSNQNENIDKNQTARIFESIIKELPPMEKEILFLRCGAI